MSNPTLSCPICDEPYEPGDLLCLNCGANLARVGRGRHAAAYEDQRQQQPYQQGPQQPYQQGPQQPYQQQQPGPPQQQDPQPAPPQQQQPQQGWNQDQWGQQHQQPQQQPAPPRQGPPQGGAPDNWGPPPPQQQPQQGAPDNWGPPQQQPAPQQGAPDNWGPPPPQRQPGQPGGRQDWGPPQPGPQQGYQGAGHAPPQQADHPLPPPPQQPNRAPMPPPHGREATLLPPDEAPGRHRPHQPPADSTAFMCPHCEAVLGDPSAAQCEHCLRPLRQQVPVLRLTFPSGELKVSVGEHLVLGRDAGQSSVAATFTQYDNVSRRHSTVWLDPSGTAWVRDEGSTNGTFINGERLPRGVEAPLRDGDQLRLAADVTGTVQLT